MALTSEQLADIRTRIPARPETDIPMPYEDLVRKILMEGTLKSDRTGTGTKQYALNLVIVICPAKLHCICSVVYNNDIVKQITYHIHKVFFCFT